MTQRAYKLVETPPGIKGAQIFEFREDGERDRLYLHLVRGRGSDIIDIVEGVQKAYESGREDRSEEILGDAGLARAAAETALHRPQGVLGDAVIANVVTCQCKRFEGHTLAQWQAHLAYEILQAAAQRP